MTKEEPVRKSTPRCQTSSLIIVASNPMQGRGGSGSTLMVGKIYQPLEKKQIREGQAK